IRSIGTFTSTDDIGHVRVGFHSGRAVTVSDVATITTGYAPRQGVVTRTSAKGQADNDDTVEGIVLMRRGQNPSVVLKALRERVAELHAHGLANGSITFLTTPKGPQVEVAAQASDENGKTITTPAGTYPGPCTPIEHPAAGVMSALRCA